MSTGSVASPDDVIVVGGGHNGLTCAAFLARAGKRVLVLEAGSQVGGFAVTEELIPQAAGFRSNPYAIDLFTGMIPRSVIHDLQLHRYGLRTYETDPYATFLGPDGSSIAQWRDVDRTAAEIARFSRRDADNYRRFASVLCEAWNALLPYLQDHPTRPGVRTVGELLWRLGKARKSLGPTARIVLSSPAAVLDDWFERDEVKVILGTWAVATGQAPLETPGYAAGMAMAVLSHKWGCHRPVGGMGALTAALAASVRAHGGRIETGAPVREILVRGGRAVGVVRDDGTEARAATVVGAIDPVRLLGLVDPSHVPDEVQRAVERLQICEHNVTYFTGHAALARRPRLPRCISGGHPRTPEGREDDLLAAGYMMLVPGYDSLRRSLTEVTQGELPTDIPIWLSLPSVRDRTLVPRGSDGETLYLMSPVAPYELADGRDWSKEKDAHLDRCLDTIEAVSPGLSDSVLGTCALSPQDMSAIATKGHACHVDMVLTQFGPWRPTPSLGGFRTPVDGLWHASAGNHPLPSVNGWAGRTVARTILKAARGKAARTTRPA